MCWRAGLSAHAAAKFAGDYKGIECSNGYFFCSICQHKKEVWILHRDKDISFWYIIVQMKIFIWEFGVCAAALPRTPFQSLIPQGIQRIAQGTAQCLNTDG